MAGEGLNAGSTRVVVDGLREATAAIKAMEYDAGKMLSTSMKRVAQIVVDDTRAKVPVGATGNARASVRPRGGVKGVSIAVGGTKAPYYMFLDFGGSTGPGHRPGKPYSGSVKREWKGRPTGKGRYLYPSIDENIVEVRDMFYDELNSLMRQFGMVATPAPDKTAPDFDSLFKGMGLR